MLLFPEVSFKIKIAEMVNSVRPKVLVPIHTKMPEEFSKVTDVRVEMAKVG